jgi:hypothetical protein
VLDNLVTGVVRTTTNDPGLLSSLVILDTDSVLTDILEPDELKGAGTIAVHTLGLVLADDNIAQGGAGAEEEDGISVTWCG